MISSFSLIVFPFLFHSIPLPAPPEEGRACAAVPPLEVRADEGCDSVGWGACGSSDTELLDAERAVRGETGGEGEDDVELLESCDPESASSACVGGVGVSRLVFGCCRVSSAADGVIIGLELAEKAGVDLDIAIEERFGVGEGIIVGVGVAGIAAGAVCVEEVEDREDDVEEREGAEEELKSDPCDVWGDRLFTKCSREEKGLVSFCVGFDPRNELDRGGDSDIVGEVPLAVVPWLLRIAGAEMLNSECPGRGGGAGIGGALSGIDVVLRLTRELVKRVYLKGG